MGCHDLLDLKNISPSNNAEIPVIRPVSFLPQSKNTKLILVPFLIEVPV